MATNPTTAHLSAPNWAGFLRCSLAAERRPLSSEVSTNDNQGTRTAKDSASTHRRVTALMDPTDPSPTVPKGHSGPHPNLVGSPAVQSKVLRTYPPIFQMEKLRP